MVISEPITLGQIMPRGAVMVSPDASLRRLRELFEAHHIHHLLVVDRHKVVGVVSDRDLLRNISTFVGNALNERGQDLATLNRKAHQVMSRHLVTATAGTTIEEAAELILEHGISCLPVVDEQMAPVSIITWRDLLRLFVPKEPNTPEMGN
jgi:acetoin utilization protein AcuB